uniref:CUB domain-containing protein n=1 Tax=Rhabditophanes sp. KR3021 TaxID=114890 RepID=A0AC35TZG6_9BILA
MVEKESDLLVRFGFLESFPAYYFDRITHFARTKTFSMLIEFFDGTAEDIFTMSSFIASKSSDITFRGQIDQGSAIFSKSRGALVLDKGASVNFSCKRKYCLPRQRNGLFL